MKIIFRIIAISFNHKWQLVGAYGCTIGATISYVLLPKYFGDGIDRIADVVTESGDGSRAAVLSIVLIIMGLSVIRGIFSFGQTYLGESLSQFVSYDIRNTFYNHVQGQSFGFHDRQHTGNLMSRAITDVENIRMFINMGLVRSPYFIALFIIVGIILVRMDWQLGLFSISFMPIVALYTVRVRLKMRFIWLVVQEKMAELSTVLQENLTGIRVVKAFVSESHEDSKFDSKNLEVSENYLKAERLRASSTSFMLFTFLVSMGLILWLGGQKVINGGMTPGGLAQFIFYLQILAMPVRMSAWLVNSYARAASAGQRLFEILDSTSPVQELSGAAEMEKVSGCVRFENVNFSYDGHDPVLHNIDLRVDPGTVVAILGMPGSGKTSMINLIPRFYDVSSGRITIDRIDVRDVTLRSLRSNIGIVQQDTFLFTASIRDNIAYGRHTASLAEVRRAAEIAQLRLFIESQQHGYDTVVGERGATLSGGQRQRMSIARAVLLDPPILILDDATSSVDAQTENEIRKAMESLMRGRTTFVIAHRLNTVQKADIVLVMKDGRIVEKGDHMQLLNDGGLYSEIVDLQLRPQEEVMREFDFPSVNQQGGGR